MAPATIFMSGKGPLAVPETRYPRVVRGGCWDDDPEQLRSAARCGSAPEWQDDDPRRPRSFYCLTRWYCPGIRVVRPLRLPTVKQCRRYELTRHDVKAFEEYERVTSGDDSKRKDKPAPKQ